MLKLVSWRNSELEGCQMWNEDPGLQRSWRIDHKEIAVKRPWKEQKGILTGLVHKVRYN